MIDRVCDGTSSDDKRRTRDGAPSGVTLCKPFAVKRSKLVSRGHQVNDEVRCSKHYYDFSQNFPSMANQIKTAPDELKWTKFVCENVRQTKQRQCYLFSESDASA
ncbi:hypothetical protein KIN20_006525 [Parelaphostrongylus tenuis]|uniref:Uncharacterized protein n=1 Tax=Parelaphostrongylus tenuis TaxID=148309 RepID=A0AAD5MU80_PARTN|nr:hypothetical protein KIN20_006525 [Parelaphostrongylus tenuis]